MHVKIKNPNPKKNTKKEANSGFFCSELVAAAYKELGLLDPHVSAAQYWPGKEISSFLMNFYNKIKEISHWKKT